MCAWLDEKGSRFDLTPNDVAVLKDASRSVSRRQGEGLPLYFIAYVLANKSNIRMRQPIKCAEKLQSMFTAWHRQSQVPVLCDTDVNHVLGVDPLNMDPTEIAP